MTTTRLETKNQVFAEKRIPTEHTNFHDHRVIFRNNSSVEYENTLTFSLSHSLRRTEPCSVVGI